MDREEKAMSYQSTLTSSDQLKASSAEETSIYLDKRKEDLNCAFDELMASVSDSSDDLSEDDRRSGPRVLAKPLIGITRNQLARKRKPHLEVAATPESERKCANLNCAFKFRGCESSLVKTSYMTRLDYYCEQCTNSIARRWTCPFCIAIYTDPSHSLEKDTFTWICCDERRCSRWTHLQCEETHRNQEINRFLSDPSYKFYCSDCYGSSKTPVDYPSAGKKRSNSTVIKAESLSTVAPSEDKVNDQSAYKDSIAAFSRCSLYTSYSYTYMHSDHYMAADKLSADKGQPLLLSEADIASDFETLLKLTGNKRFVLSVNNLPQPVQSTDRLSNRKKQYKSVLDNRPL
jgi:hypothetical protein